MQRGRRPAPTLPAPTRGHQIEPEPGEQGERSGHLHPVVGMEDATERDADHRREQPRPAAGSGGAFCAPRQPSRWGEQARARPGRGGTARATGRTRCRCSSYDPWISESMVLRCPTIANHHSSNPTVASPWRQASTTGRTAAPAKTARSGTGCRAPPPAVGEHERRRPRRAPSAAACFVNTPPRPRRRRPAPAATGRRRMDHHAPNATALAVPAMARSSPLAVKPSRCGAGDSTANSSAATTAARRPARAHAAAATATVTIDAATIASTRAIGPQPEAATTR